MRGRSVVVGIMVLAALPASRAQGSSPGLPEVGSGQRPGPDALYLPAAQVPQLENVAPWEAEPILVSGAAAYADGEFLYQDHLYDDHGAAGSIDPGAPVGSRAHLFSPTAGTYTYPTVPSTYAHNAADLVELRIKPLEDATAFRVTVNTMLDPERLAFTIALGGQTGDILPATVPWPFGANVSSPAERFLTVHGSTAILTAPGSTTPITPAPTASVDPVRHQIDARIPTAAWDPGTASVRVTIGVGIWDPAAGAYLAPQPGAASATTPGGAAPSRAAIVNVGPRLHEPNPDLTQIPTYTIGDAAAGAAVQARWWRERQQADALRIGDVTPFAVEVDFAKLAARIDDDALTPKTGAISRILASRYAFGQGLDPTKVCYAIGGANLGAACQGRLQGALQPYALYVPETPPPAEGWGMTLLLHSLSANHHQYAGSRNQAQLGRRGGGNLVVTPSGRGPDGFYAGFAEADTFETWADVARHYPVDPDRAVVSGYSMGGYGTYRLLARYPDLFSAGFSVVGIPGSADPMIASMRNTPIIAWTALADELVNIQSTEQTLQRLTAAGLRVTSWLFPTADHLTLATNDEYQPGVDQLEVTDVDRAPAHVTFVVNPGQDNAAAGVVADHAYWVSDVQRRGASGTGTIDVVSHAFGVGDAPLISLGTTPGVLLGGVHGPKPYVQRGQAWGPAPAIEAADRLVIRATNVSSATVDPVRARISCDAELQVTSDGPFTLTVTGCGTFSF